ncbi:hypothetical protein CBS101457_003594 [Exobasidium rhododendri]|nr:hypothetical protein CBS101457_003594 [Exobasidium rhododendri]
MPRNSSLETVGLNGVSVDLGLPFTFDPFGSVDDEPRLHGQPGRGRSSLRVARRPDQGGLSPSANDEHSRSNMSSSDRASIFRGLSTGVTLEAEMPSDSTSIKRSFEEAISPLHSPLSNSRGPGLSSGITLGEASTSRDFSSSISHPFDAVGESVHNETLIRAARRRVACKRQRAATQLRHASDTGSSRPSATEGLNGALRNGEGSSSQYNRASASFNQPRTPDPHVTHEESSQDSRWDLAILPSSMTNYLRHWCDYSGSQVSLSGSHVDAASNRSTVGDAESEDGPAPVEERSNSAVELDLTQRSIFSSLMSTQELTEASERQTFGSQPQRQIASGREGEDMSDYHDELMDVFRRMNRRTDRTTEEWPRTRLRSTTLHRLTSGAAGLASSITRSDAASVDPPTEQGDRTAPAGLFSPTEREDPSVLPSTFLPSARSQEAHSSVHRIRHWTDLQARASIQHRSSTSLLNGSPSSSRNVEAALHRDSPLQQPRVDSVGMLHSLLPASHRVHSNARQSRSMRDVNFVLDSAENFDNAVSESLSSPSLWSEENMSRLGPYEAHLSEGRDEVSANIPASNFEPYEEEQSQSLFVPSASRRGNIDRSHGSSRLSIDDWQRLTGFDYELDETDQLDVMLGGIRSFRPTERVADGRRSSIIDSTEVGQLQRGTFERTPEVRVEIQGSDGDDRGGDTARNGAPQLPTLRSRSPLEFPYETLAQSRAASQEADEGRTSRPVLRPLTLSSRAGLSYSSSSSADLLDPALSTRRYHGSASNSSNDTSFALHSGSLSRRLPLATTMSSTHGAHRPAVGESFHWRTSMANDQRVEREWFGINGEDGSTSTLRRSSPLRNAFDLGEHQDGELFGGEDTLARVTANRTLDRIRLRRDARQNTLVNDPPTDRTDLLANRRRYRALPERRERDLNRSESSALSPLSSNRLMNQLSSRTVRHRSSIGMLARRRPTLLDSDSSTVNMELEMPNYGGHNASRPQVALRHSPSFHSRTFSAREAEDDSQATSPRLSLPNWLAPVPPPLQNLTRGASSSSRRWERFLSEVGTSTSGTSSLDSTLEGQAGAMDDYPMASPSLFSLSHHSRATRSDIASNPANYVADYDFALRDSYEDLLQLSAQVGEVRSKSTPDHVIKKLHTCVYALWSGGSCARAKQQCGEEEEEEEEEERSSSLLFSLYSHKGKGKARAKERQAETESRSFSKQGCGEKDASCSICLEDYRGKDKVMSLPCHHAFHADCATAWLKTARTCPCCRGDVCAGTKGEETVHTHHTLPWSRILPELNF